MRFGPVELKILANTWSRPEYWVWIESGATYGHDQHAITVEKNVSTFFTLWTPHTACTGSDHVMPGHFHANLIWPLEIKPRRGEWGEWPGVYVALTPSEREGGADTQEVGPRSGISEFLSTTDKRHEFLAPGTRMHTEWARHRPIGRNRICPSQKGPSPGRRGVAHSESKRAAALVFHPTIPGVKPTMPDFDIEKSFLRGADFSVYGL